MAGLDFIFGDYSSSAHISRAIPNIAEMAADAGTGNHAWSPLIICDEHSATIADAICAPIPHSPFPTPHSPPPPRCVLRSGEQHKNWSAVEAILRAAHDAGLGRDGVFVGVGGGVIGDLSACAASLYMRGCGLALVSTTLLGMVDAGLGGKTGFDLFGVKNLAGTFYPARHLYLPLESLAGLPPPEWKSGMAELIKTAVLAGDDMLDELEALAAEFPAGAFDAGFPPGFAPRLLAGDAERLYRCISRAVAFKGGVVASDPRETGTKRMLLNLGHTFAHALESAAGLGTVSHGEAVAWGMVRACELGLAAGITPRARAEAIQNLITRYGYETRAPHPRAGDTESLVTALGSDKKKKGGTLTFIVPAAKGAVPFTASAPDMETVTRILSGGASF